MYLVTGATGHLGGLVAGSLLRGGHRVRLMVRGAIRPAAAEHPRAEVVRADFNDLDSLRAALARVDAAFLVCAETPDRPLLEEGFIRAAAALGVRLVKLSALGAAPDAPTFLRWHHETEEHLRASASGWAVLRANSFMDNLPRNDAEMLSDGVWPNALGSARVSLLSGTDLADVAAAVMIDRSGRYDGMILELTGPQALSASDIADAAAEVLGHPVRPRDLPPDELASQLRRHGAPDWFAEGLRELHTYVRGGHADLVSNTIEQILHRTPTTLADYLSDHLTPSRGPTPRRARR